jgi:hypothetical protein
MTKEIEDPKNQIDMFSVSTIRHNQDVSIKTVDLSNLMHIYSFLPKRVNHVTNVENGVVKRDVTCLFGSGPNAITEELSITVGSAVIDIMVKDAESGVMVEKTVIKLPGLREDRIEEGLIYLATQNIGNSGIIQKSIEVVGVYFVLGQLLKAIKKVSGTSYKYDEIREGLFILSNSALNIRPSKKSKLGNEFIINSNRIKTLILKDAYRDDEPCYAEFHPLLAVDISQSAFQLYGVEYQAKIRKPLGILLYKKLCAKYKQASPDRPYNFSGKTFLKSSHLGFNPEKAKEGWRVLREALNSLISAGVIKPDFDEDIKISEIRKNSYDDIIFTVYATADFAKHFTKVNYINKVNKGLNKG